MHLCLNASVDILEGNAYLKDVYSEGNYDMFISFTTAKTKDMDTVWTNLFHTENIGQGNCFKLPTEMAGSVWR